MFQIQDFTEVHLASVTNRIEKHGDEDVPAVSLSVSFTTENTLLDLIDPGLRHALFKAKPDAEPELPEMEQTTPVLRCNSIEKLTLTTAHEGWRLAMDQGIDESAPLEFGGCKVDKITVDAHQGGSVTIKLRVGTSDVDAERLGKLAVNNGQSIWIKLLKPAKPADVIDGTVGHPGAAAAGESAEDLFAQQHGGPDDDGPQPGDDDDDGASPDDDAAAFEAGAAAALAGAGVKPARGKRAKVLQ
jgi:hypothetical protein